MPRMDIPRRLLPLLKPKRFKIVIGGRGGAKSMSISSILLAEVQAKKIKKVACFREFQNSINDSSHALLAGQIESLGLETGADGFEVQNNQINHNGESAFIFKGLARNPESIKSMHGQERYFIDEAQTISENSLRALTPTLREEESEIWFSANPRSAQDPFSQRFIKPFEKELRRDKFYEDDLHTIIWVNYNNNPFFPDVLEQERLYDKEHMSSALYRHVWLGEFYDESQDSIIPAEWYDSSIDSHLKLGFQATGAIIASHDPSVGGEGNDAQGYSVRKGSVILDVCENFAGDVNEGMDWALHKARSDGADWFVWDCDGLGISLKRQVDQELEHSKIERVMFRGSATADDANVPYSGKDSKTNRDTFTNKRAQYWWKLRDRFEATHRAVTKGEYIDPDLLISLSSSIDSLDQLRSEVCRIEQTRNNNGKIQIKSKIDMAKAKIPSPNMADSLMMSMFSPKARVAEAAKINFAGWGN
tara:strand:- start:1312 stop:2739 length:1428 start_codon:yes stop_codon:yes gene_type:complete